MALAAAQAALDDDEHVLQTRRLVADGLRYLTRALDEMYVGYIPSVANFMLVKVGQGRKMFTALQRKKVIVRPMDGYGLPDYVRVTVGLKKRERALHPRAAGGQEGRGRLI